MNKTFVDNDYPVDVESDIEPSLRWSNSTTSAPPAQKNGGLYGGPENRAPWMPIPVVPTSTYFMTTLLDSANPPPNAKYHYPSENRPGNNYSASPNIYWFNSSYDPQKKNQYNIKIIKKKD